MAGVRLFQDPVSGNCYKASLLLNLLDRQFESVYEDVFAESHPTPALLAVNANGKVPVLVDDGFVLPESNAILTYLAKGTQYLPEEPRAFAEVCQWLFFEQYSHEPYIAVARAWKRFKPDHPDLAATLDRVRPGGEKALAVMEGHLMDRDWFAAGRFTIADISLFAYTHAAEEGGFDLKPYPNVRAWLERVRGVPGFVPMEA